VECWSFPPRYDDTYTQNANASWQKEGHDIRFGFDMIHLRLNH